MAGGEERQDSNTSSYGIMGGDRHRMDIVPRQLHDLRPNPGKKLSPWADFPSVLAQISEHHSMSGA